MMLFNPLSADGCGVYVHNERLYVIRVTVTSPVEAVAPRTGKNYWKEEKFATKWYNTFCV